MGGETKVQLFWEHFSSIQFPAFLPWCARCWKSDALVRAEGIDLPLIHSLPHHLLPLSLEILCLSLRVFMFWSAIPQRCEPNSKSIYSCFWCKVETLRSHRTELIRSLFNHCLSSVRFCTLSMGLPALCFYFILFWGRGKLLYGGIENACHFGGGVHVWDRVGCQFLSGTEVCVAVSLWQGDQGVGARQGLTWSKTQMQSHIGKVREREKSHAELHTYPPFPPLFCPFSHNNSHGRDEPWLNRGIPCTPPLPRTPIDLQQQKWEKQTLNSDCTCHYTWPMDRCRHQDSRF